jgi:hypothetical protein
MRDDVDIGRRSVRHLARSRHVTRSTGRQHYSLYPATDHIVAAFKDDLAPYEVNKGTIRFPLSQPVPAKLIGRIAKVRAQEVNEREKAKAATPKKLSGSCLYKIGSAQQRAKRSAK